MISFTECVTLVRICLLLLLISVMSCTSSRDSGNYEVYKELVEAYEESLTDSVTTDRVNKENKEFLSALSEDEVQNILANELEDIMNDPGEPMGSSGPERGEVQPPGIRSCASNDRAGMAILKTFKRQKLFFSSIFTRKYRIRLAVHIIENAAGQVVSERDLFNQIDILNKAYRPINLVFEVAATTRTSDNSWYYASPVDDNQTNFNSMVQTLNSDPSRYINIYINGMTDWGYGSFPWEAEYQTPYDCVVIKDMTLPGKVLDDNCQTVVMMGKTLVHEMGHFLGLFHTFHSDQLDEDGHSIPCNSDSFDGCFNGDEVDDTPPQRYCHFYGCGECISERGCCTHSQQCNHICDTCPNDNFPDAVKNYMGYNPDACMDHFTQGQYDRMEIWFFSKRKYASY